MNGQSTQDEVDSVRALVSSVAASLGWAGECAQDVRTIDDAQAILDAALEVISSRVNGNACTSERARLMPVVDEVRRAQVMIHESISRRRSASVSYMRTAVDNLRNITTVAELVSRAPIEVGRLGFDRCLLSKISDSKWVTRSAYVNGDDAFADAMVDVGNRNPRVIDSRLVECELVRQRKSLLVRDAMHNDRVHPELVRFVKPVAYVVAPIIARGSVVGFLHADTGSDAAPVDEFDRDLLDAFATSLSITLEGLYYREQLDRIRQHMDGLGTLSSCLLGDDDHTEGDSRDRAKLLPPSTRSLLQTAGTLLDKLTRREVEVLMHMANGETNRRIAARLFVSEATVKAHVKHILRKLDAANRAEAVSRYFRDFQAS